MKVICVKIQANQRSGSEDWYRTDKEIVTNRKEYQLRQRYYTLINNSVQQVGRQVQRLQ